MCLILSNLYILLDFLLSNESRTRVIMIENGEVTSHRLVIIIGTTLRKKMGHQCSSKIFAVDSNFACPLPDVQKRVRTFKTFRALKIVFLLSVGLSFMNQITWIFLYCQRSVRSKLDGDGPCHHEQNSGWKGRLYFPQKENQGKDGPCSIWAGK